MPRRNITFSAADDGVIKNIQNASDSPRGLSGPLLDGWPESCHPHCTDCGEKIQVGYYYRIKEGPAPMRRLTVHCANRHACAGRLIARDTMSFSNSRQEMMSIESAVSAKLATVEDGSWKIPMPSAFSSASYGAFSPD